MERAPALPAWPPVTQPDSLFSPDRGLLGKKVDRVPSLGFIRVLEGVGFFLVKAGLQPSLPNTRLTV